MDTIQTLANAGLLAQADTHLSPASTAMIVNLVYLIAAMLFIGAFKLLAHPRTAVRGNFLGAVGMLLAIGVTLFDRQILDFTWIIAGLVIGGGIGAFLAVTVKMTAMPQMVGLLNGFGGGASTLVAGASLLEGLKAHPELVTPHSQFVIATAASGFIGAITFFGSLVAYLKLEEKVFGSKPVWFPNQQLLNAVLALVAIGLGFWLSSNPNAIYVYWLLVIVSAALGVLLTIPIGGADMPVVICLLNSYSGLAAAATGFVLENNMLIIAGSLVGASGLILTQIMCKAMNRSMANVVFARFGPSEGGPTQDEVYAGKIKSVTADEIAMMLDGVQRVVIVPGYGLAVSQAQHSVRDFANLLESRGATVEYAIHPVAGRMPGHMNVLLAEADIPYEKLLEMDAINPTLETVDVGIVVGANDVVNPLARTDPKSPIAGMPIIDIDKCRAVIVIKRSLSPGFAGIPNPLFANPNTSMFFNDGKKAFAEMIAAIKENG